MDPINYLFEKPVLNSRMSRWTLMLSEFDLKYVPLKAIKGKVVADFLADNPVEETDIVDTWSFPDKDIVHVEDDAWDLYFDGASNNMGCGIGVLIISPRGEHVPVLIKLDFAVTNNAAEYEACLLGLQSANNMPLCVEQRSSPAYINVVDDAEESEAEPWYASIVRFKEAGEYSADLDTRGKRALRMLSAQFVKTNDGQLYKKTKTGVLLRCVDKTTSEKVMEEVHDGECGPHMNSHMLVRKIMRGQVLQSAKCEASSQVYSNDIIRCGVPHEFINDHGTHFQAETAVILEKYRIKHHKSSPYRPQTNGAVEAANKTVATVLRKMSDNYKEWPEKIPFALWGYRTSIRTATWATPNYLVYGMEAVQPVELEVPSLRILLESQVPEADWVQARYDSLVLLDECRLNALYHVQLYQKRIERAFNKKVKSRGINEGDLVLKSVRALLPVDPRGKFKPNWAGPYLVKKILTGGTARLTDLDGNDFSNPTNLDQLKKYYP
ncbi:uncharacterized protein LOC141638833 [Silene latifolia]|uniref:uncharacterized protein LOC141638833 n=1 Tax=Silene latifolia TaxID=37657 RepID=UPI003D76C382